jgi:SOS-response transcriptional repressor LexA
VELKPLTKKQAKVLEFIIRKVEEGTGHPTLREMGHAFKMRSTGSTRDVTRALVQKGYLVLQPGKSRGRMLNPEVFRIEVKGKNKIRLKK